MATAEDEENSASREIIDMQLGKCKYVRVGDNITYIGVGVVLRDSEGVLEILMVQEAKRRCYGKWYIPSGRIERGETIVEGVSREVLEETGYKCDPEELLCLQVQGSGWYRFAFYCSVIGGERKTVADAESLASDWFPVEDVRAKKIETRGTDFLKILDDALRYRSWRTHHPQTLRQFLPISANVRGLFIEFLIMRHAKYKLALNLYHQSLTVNAFHDAGDLNVWVVEELTLIEITKTELLVRHDITDCEQILHSSNVFPLAEFGFEYFFAMVVSKCFQGSFINRRVLCNSGNFLDVIRLRTLANFVGDRDRREVRNYIGAQKQLLAKASRDRANLFKVYRVRSYNLRRSAPKVENSRVECVAVGLFGYNAFAAR
ncbi:unnamed protein product [Toxocara canis]|uniref:Nudix hydrolase domain-containing protein n=1 Tax=Toxocara canis TaxID=6265 RepID=A0A183V8H9_TOXCA|nr:unnamed protein product [Toxocara canis]